MLRSPLIPRPQPPQRWVSIEINPGIVTLDRGRTQQFTASVAVSDPENMSTDIIWSVESSGGSSITSTGLLTVGIDEQPHSTIRVIAQSVEDLTYEADAEVVVSDVPLLAIVVNPYTVTLDRGRTQQFTATVTAPDGVPTTVSWSLIGAVASTISNTGLLTLHVNEIVASIIRVRATSTYDSSVYNEAIVTVSSAVLPAVTSVTVSPSTVSVNRNSTTQFTAQVVAVGGASTAVTWSITGNTTANTTISNTGSLRVHNQQTSGSTIIVTARSNFDNTVYGTATVSVR